MSNACLTSKNDRVIKGYRRTCSQTCSKDPGMIPRLDVAVSIFFGLAQFCPTPSLRFQPSGFTEENTGSLRAAIGRLASFFGPLQSIVSA